MPKRRSVPEDLMHIATQMPWQAGFVLAAVSWVGLHLVAAQTVQSPAGLQDFGKLYAGTLIVTVARILQYVVPLCVLIGAGVSAVRRSRAAALPPAALKLQQKRP